MESAIEGKMPGGTREWRSIRTGLAICGLVFVLGMAYQQWSFDAYRQATDRAADAEIRLGQLVTVRGQIAGVMQSVSQEGLDETAQSLAIDRRVFNLQQSWNDLREHPRSDTEWRVSFTGAEGRLDAGVDRLALAGLRLAVALRRGDPEAVGRQASLVSLADSNLSVALSGLQLRAEDTRMAAEAGKRRAAYGMNYGRSLATGAFAAFASLLLISLLTLGYRSLREWMAGRATTVLAAGGPAAEEGWGRQTIRNP